jgi:DNA-binding transcriptional LysR family regulator
MLRLPLRDGLTVHPMLLKNLQYLFALAQERHFARAAAACSVTQPTLSAGIKQLEEELGLLIVERGQRFEGLTPEGHRVLTWATRILADCESLQQEASELRAGLVGRLRIGVIPVALPMASLLTAPFMARHPQVLVTVLTHTSAEIQRGLDGFSLDAGITYLDNEPLAHVDTVPLYRERYYLFTQAGNPLGRKSRVSWREAASLPLILLTPDMQNRRIVNGYFKSAGTSVHPQIESNSVLALWGHLAGGPCSSVLPQTFLHLFGVPPGVAAVPMDEPAAGHMIGLVVPDREPRTPSARELTRLAAELDLAALLGTPEGATAQP